MVDAERLDNVIWRIAGVSSGLATLAGPLALLRAKKRLYEVYYQRHFY